MTIFFHAILGSHPQSTFLAYVNARYLRGCSGLSEAEIRKYINVGPATEMGHMKMVQVGRHSTTAKSDRDRKPLQLINQHAQAVLDAVNVPDQELDNK